MRRGNKLEEDGRVHREVTPNANRPHGRKRAERHVIRRSAGRYGEDACDEECDIEGDTTAPDVGSYAPEDGADEESNVLPKLEEGSLELEFLDDWG